MQEQMPQDLKERCQFHWFKSSKEAGERIADADVIITAGRLNPDTLKRATKLKWMQTISAGVDKLPLARVGRASSDHTHQCQWGTYHPNE